MRTLQGPGRDNEPDPFASLVKQIADLRRGIDDATAQVLRMAGLRAEPDLLRVLGSLVVEGDLSVPSGVIKLAGVDQDLATAVANITALVGAQVAILTGTASTPVAVNLTASMVDYAVVTFTVPSGYTRAYVVGISSMYYGGVSAVVALGTAIAGGLGYVMPGVAPPGNVPASHAAALIGLVGGNTFTVSSQAERQTSAAANAGITTTAIAAFLR